MLAVVAGAPITSEDVARRLGAIRRGALAPRLPASGPEDRRGTRWVLRLLIAEAIVLHHAGLVRRLPVPEAGRSSVNGLDLGSASDLSSAAERIFEQVTSGVVVPEDELLDYYLRNRDLYHLPERRLIRHVLAGDAPGADRIAAGWGRSTPPAATFEIRRGELVGPFEEAVFAGRVGDLVGPVPSELGWHVAMIEAVYESGYMPFDEVRSVIEADLLSHARGRAFDLWLERERQTLAMVLPDWGHPGDPASPVFNHRH